MSNVLDFSAARRQKYIRGNVEEVRTEVIAALAGTELAKDGEDAIHATILKDLDALTDDILIRKLQLVHAREAAERGWTAQEAEMAAEMEAAAYLAYRAGVPEEAIYDLDYTPLSDALSNAMRKVQSA